jgi:hypothetical protein
MNDTDKATLAIFVACPEQCSHALQGLKTIARQLTEPTVVTILEAEQTDCDTVDQQISNLVMQLEHRYFSTKDEFTMRRTVALESNADYILCLEDHGLISPHFLEGIADIMRDQQPAALTFYGSNGTTRKFGGRALYNWTWGMADIGLHPQRPEPVCSGFLLERRQLALHQERTGKPIEIGELEAIIIPTLIRDHPYEPDKRVTVVHFQETNYRQSIAAVFSNAANQSSLESKIPGRKLWIPRMLKRHFGRLCKKLVDRRYPFGMKLAFVPLAISAFAGSIYGRFVGADATTKLLAKLHSKVGES